MLVQHLVFVNTAIIRTFPLPCLRSWSASATDISSTKKLHRLTLQTPERLSKRYQSLCARTTPGVRQHRDQTHISIALPPLMVCCTLASFALHRPFVPASSTFQNNTAVHKHHNGPSPNTSGQTTSIHKPHTSQDRTWHAPQKGVYYNISLKTTSHWYRQIAVTPTRGSVLITQ